MTLPHLPARTRTTLSLPHPERGTSRRWIEARRFQNVNNDGMEEEQPVVMLVEGWSLGPLISLRAGLRRGNKVHIVQPRIPMPPLFGCWCWNVPFLILFSVFVAYVWYLSRPRLQAQWPHLWWLNHSKNDHEVVDTEGPPFLVGWLEVALHAVVVLVSIRVMVVVVVRSSKLEGMKICQQYLRQHNVSIVVAFSWGGAVVVDMIAAGYLGPVHNKNNNNSNNKDDHHNGRPIRVLLLAPANTLVAQVAWQSDPVLSLSFPTPNRTDDSSLDAAFSSAVTMPNHPLIYVVHASEDSSICPHPERWQQHSHHSATHSNQSSPPVIGYEMLQDVHIFQQPSSKQRIVTLVEQMLRQQTNRPHERFWMPPPQGKTKIKTSNRICDESYA